MKLRKKKKKNEKNEYKIKSNFESDKTDHQKYFEPKTEIYN